jgi:hypothetical protein
LYFAPKQPRENSHQQEKTSMKTLLATALLITATLSAQAQSQVQFQNSVSFVTVADRLVYASWPGLEPLVGTNWVVGLWYIPGAGHSELASATGGTQAGGTGYMRGASSLGTKGQWLNAIAVGNTRTLDGVAAGAFATLQVRVWDIDKYATFAQALAGGVYAWSAPFDWKAPVLGDPPSAMFMDNLRAFQGPLAPEPATIALGALGAASLVWLRRKARVGSRPVALTGYGGTACGEGQWAVGPTFVGNFVGNFVDRPTLNAQH